MRDNRTLIRWITFVVVAICSFLTLFFIQQRYTSVQESGRNVQWPVKVVRKYDWIPSDYLTVKFIGTKAHLDDQKNPKIGDKIYIKIGIQQNGLAFVKGASVKLPVRDRYILGNVKSVKDQFVEFTIPDSRVRIDVDKVDPKFYDPTYKGILIGSLKTKDGKMVVDGVFSKGVSILNAKPETVKKIEDPKKLLEEKFKKEKDSKDDTKKGIKELKEKKTIE